MEIVSTNPKQVKITEEGERGELVTWAQGKSNPSSDWQDFCGKIACPTLPILLPDATSSATMMSTVSSMLKQDVSIGAVNGALSIVSAMLSQLWP
jgi:hypothetical protein